VTTLKMLLNEFTGKRFKRSVNHVHRLFGDTHLKCADIFFETFYEYILASDIFFRTFYVTRNPKLKSEARFWISILESPIQANLQMWPPNRHFGYPI